MVNVTGTGTKSIIEKHRNDSYCRAPFLSSQWDTIILINQCRPYLSKTTYAPKFVDVHMFSEKLKDVTEKTNIRQLGLIA